MKKIVKSSILIALIFIAACSDNNNVVDDVFANTTSGGVLRTIQVVSADIAVGEPNAEFNVIVEVQDAKDGALSDKIDVYARFTDNNNAGANDRSETLIKSIPNSSFIGGNRLPRADVKVSIAELLAGLNLTGDQYSGGDRFVIRLALVMKDGRVFSNNNGNANIVGGSYFNSPFVYNSNVVCPINESLAGTHTFQSFNMRRGPSAAGVACGGTINGTVTWTNTDVPGEYATSDLSFGQFGACWGDSPATSASAKIKWFCKKLEALGVDQYGDSYTYTMVTVSGNQMTIDWINTYNDRGRTIITRQGGANWPAIFQTP